MATTMRDIPSHEWPSFFDAFSRQHHGWLAALELLDPDIGAQLEADALPFEGIATDRGGPTDTISIMLGADAGRHVTHTIPSPSHVRLEQTTRAGGVVKTLEIETSDGPMTLLHFQANVFPELPDELF